MNQQRYSCPFLQKENTTTSLIMSSGLGKETSWGAKLHPVHTLYSRSGMWVTSISYMQYNFVLREAKVWSVVTITSINFLKDLFLFTISLGTAVRMWAYNNIGTSEIYACDCVIHTLVVSLPCSTALGSNESGGTSGNNLSYCIFVGTRCTYLPPAQNISHSKGRYRSRQKKTFGRII